MTTAIETLSAANADTIAKALVGQSTGTLARVPASVAKVPTFSMHGDSIANNMGQMGTDSCLFWALAKQPRQLKIIYDKATSSSGQNDYGGNMAVSGAKSGDLYAGWNRTGTKQYTMNANDMCDPTRLARVTAYAPDIMFVHVGTNDVINIAPDATVLNVKDLIAANPNPQKQIVLMSQLPQNAVTQDSVRFYNHWARHMANTYPGYHFVDWGAYATDDQVTATWSWRSGLSADGRHPGIGMGRLAYPLFDQLFDRLGVRRSVMRHTHFNDAFSNPAGTTSGSGNPGGNILGARGTMNATGTPVTVSTPGMTGTLPVGWSTPGNTGDTTNLLITFSIGTMTDANGIVHKAIIATITNPGGVALTANSAFPISVNWPVGATTTTGIETSCTALVQFQSVTGMNALQMSSNSEVYSFGAGSYGTSKDLPASFTDTLNYANPWRTILTTGSANKITFNFLFSAGSNPSGVVAIAQTGLWYDIGNAYD